MSFRFPIYRGEKSLLDRIIQKTKRKGFLHLVGGQVTYVRNDNVKVGMTPTINEIITRTISRLGPSLSRLQGEALQIAASSRNRAVGEAVGVSQGEGRFCKY